MRPFLQRPVLTHGWAKFRATESNGAGQASDHHEADRNAAGQAASRSSPVDERKQVAMNGIGKKQRVAMKQIGKKQIAMKEVGKKQNAVKHIGGVECL